MSPSILVSLAVLAASTAPPADLPPCPTSEDSPDLVKLLTRQELAQQGNSSVAVMNMAIKTPTWSRALSMKVWSKGRDLALVRVLEGGPRETGMMTLKREKQLWNWLPQAGRVMKLPSGMLGDSWLGSDFTNDDLVRGSSLARDFDSRVSGLGEVDGRKVWQLVLVPRKDAVVVWGRVELEVDRATCVGLATRYFDEDGKLVRTMVSSDVKQLGWRAFAMKLTVTPQEPGRQTVITYGDLEFDVPIPDDTFSVHRLGQGK
jgi:Outer membrane lipoprotein-sorting protein